MPGNDLTYDALWQTSQKEKRTNELQLVPKTFYDDMTEFINGMEKESHTEEEKQRASNAARMFNELYARRKQKIMMYVAYGRQLPSQMPQQDTDLYDEAAKVMKAAELSSGAAAQKPQLKVMQDIPEIILPSGRRVGPLARDQTIEIKEKDDRMFLVNNKICKDM